MANNIVFMDGFELNSYELWDVSSGAHSLVASKTGMGGSYCLRLYANGYIQRDLSANKSEIWVGCRAYVDAGNVQFYVQFLDSTPTAILSITRNTTSGYLEARLGNTGGTLLATGTHAININTTYLIEIHLKPLNSGGAIDVKVDGLSDISYSGDTTNGNEHVRHLRVGSGGAPFPYVDDIIIDDGDWTGNLKIAAIIKPDGAGTTTQWTPSAGDNYACVDEIPPSDTDYNSTNTTGNIDLFSCNDIAGNISSIRGMQFNARMAYEGAPTPTHIELGIRTHSANYFSADISPPVTPAQKTWVQMNNPNTGNPWTVEEINALEIGYKSTA